MDQKTKQDKIEAAINAHFAWFERLKKTIATKQSDFKPEIVAKDNQCEFGKWIYTDLKDICDEQTLLEIKKCHAEFHKKASEVLTMALSGNSMKAEIGSTSDLKHLSGRLVLDLRRLQG